MLRAFLTQPRGLLEAARLAILTTALLAALAPSAGAQAILPDGFSEQIFLGGIDLATSMTFLPDGRLLFLEQRSGRVRMLVNGAPSPIDPVFTVDSVSYSSERGLLGVAVDPGWPVRPYVYLQYTYGGAPEAHISRYEAIGDLDFTGNGAFTLDPASRFHVITSLPDSHTIHNGGTLRFGPDGRLYSSHGDDGGSCGAQSKQILRGKILRLDVSGLPAGPGGPPPLSAITPADNPFVAHPDQRARLVWQFGLRNPWSFQVDAPTGDLFIADVGELSWEELDQATAPGLNFGWPMYEGPMRKLECVTADTAAGITMPIAAYDRTEFPIGGTIVTAGRYRRPASGSGRFPAEYDGDVFYSDMFEGFLRRLRWNGTTWETAPPVPGQPSAEDWARGLDGVSDYAIGPEGALWYLRWSKDITFFSGQIGRIAHDGVTSVPRSSAGELGLAAFPSPGSGTVRLAFELPRPSRVRLRVFDVAGRVVHEALPSAILAAGRHEVGWDGRVAGSAPAPAGLYLARLDVDGRATHRRFMRLR
jgi:glucose/arabinose dehydrogenase